MKTKTLTPPNTAPVKREKAGNGAGTNAIVPSLWPPIGGWPFAGDDAQ